MASRFRLAMPLLVLLGGWPFAAAQAEPAARDYWPTDGWREAAPEERGIDRAALNEADRLAASELPDLSALLVVRGGDLVFERYYGGQEADEPVNTRSVTKSVMSALVGIALGEGLLEGLDQTLGELIPDRLPADADPRTADITVEQLLTMTAGWEWDIGSDYQRLIGSDDWVGLTLGLPVVHAPGEVYAYNSGGSHLLSVILEEVTGRATADYAAERLFGPLGIQPGDWEESPQGEASGGFGLELTPRDMAKFGFLYLNGGEWDGEQLVPADYVQASTSYQSAGDATGGAAYGYQWWLTDASGYGASFALGYGGQYIYVVPDLDLVVVAAVARRVPGDELRSPRPLIEGVIIPAAVGRSPQG
jgi:CubicO group peptidase (beta-lactamase class C family)